MKRTVSHLREIEIYLSDLLQCYPLISKVWTNSLPTLILLTFFVLTDRVIAGEKPSVIVPESKISLFNGRDLSSFYTWLPDFGREDPHCVFTVVDKFDGAPAIRISGQFFGGLITHNSYANYKLIVEFRWGAITWNPRMNKARDSGILLHCQGEEGNYRADHLSPWMHSIEYQIIEGGTGDIILLGRYRKDTNELIPMRLTVRTLGDTRVWNPSGTPTDFERGRIDWQHRDPDWKDVIDFRGSKDVEKLLGAWNLIEVICINGNFDYYLNGVKVNEGKNGSLTSGKLLFQSEGAEIYFRRIEIHPLPQ